MTLDLPPRRRRWPLFAIAAAVIVLAAGWSAFWFYASAQADQRFEEWKAREAQAGRVYDCADRSISGYPFRFEMRCGSVSASVAAPVPLTIEGGGIVLVAQVYTPDLFIAEFTGPVSISQQGQQPAWIANWKLGESSVRGLPSSPQRVSLVWDEPVITNVQNSVEVPMFNATHAEIHGRLGLDSTPDNPVIEIASSLTGASIPGVHPVLVKPFDSSIDVQLRGLRDISPKPWPVLLRQMQQAGGQIQIVNARIQQGDTIAVGSGSLSLNAIGQLEGELTMTVANMEAIVPDLGLDKLFDQGVSQSTVDRIAPGVKADDVNKVFGALDRLMPGLGNVAKRQANAGVAAGLAMLGDKTTLEGRPAQTYPLRFVDGTIFIGPFQVAQAPPLF
jgi:hypothetical protein